MIITWYQSLVLGLGTRPGRPPPSPASYHRHATSLPLPLPWFTSLMPFSRLDLELPTPRRHPCIMLSLHPLHQATATTSTSGRRCRLCIGPSPLPFSVAWCLCIGTLPLPSASIGTSPPPSPGAFASGPCHRLCFVSPLHRDDTSAWYLGLILSPPGRIRTTTPALSPGALPQSSHRRPRSTRLPPPSRIQASSSSLVTPSSSPALLALALLVRTTPLLLLHQHLDALPTTSRSREGPPWAAAGGGMGPLLRTLHRRW